MAINRNYPLDTLILPGGQLVDVSAASISYVAIPVQGIILTAWACIAAAITGADSVVTVKVIKAAVTTTIGTITIALTGSAIGNTYEMAVTGSEAARTVGPGDTLVFDSDGASSTTSIANFIGIMRFD